MTWLPRENIHVTAVSDLIAIDTTDIPNGTLAQVSVIDDTWELSTAPSSAVVTATDGLNIVQPTNVSTHRWIRKFVRNLSAQYAASWWIDPSAGLDTNDGITSNTPLKTLTEWCVRMEGATINQDVTVTCASGTITGDIVLKGINIVSPNIITILGNSSVDGGHTVTGVTASVPSTNTRGFITSADNFTDQQRLRFTSGTMNNAIAYVTGTNGLTNGYISTPGVVTDFHPNISSGSPTTGFPATNDTYVVETLNTTLNPPNINIKVIGSGRFIFRNLNFAFLFNGNAQVAIINVQNENAGSTTSGVFFYGCALPSSSEFFWFAGSQAECTNCWFNGSVAAINNSIIFFRTSVFRKAGGSFGGLYAGENGYIQLASSNVFDSGSLIVDRGQVEMNGSDIQVCDGAGGAWFTGAVGTTVYGHVSARVWGPTSGFTRAFVLFTGCTYVYSILPTVASTNSPLDISMNSVHMAYTDLPYANPVFATSMAILQGGV